MDFESRFFDKFRTEDEFPTPRPLGTKRRESFSDQFFKSTLGASLKLRSKGTLKLSKISALKFRQKFMPSSTKRRSVPSIGKSETNLSTTLEHIDTPRRSSFYIPRSDSGSVDCLPVSVNADSFLPISNNSSVITLSKPNTMKMSSRTKFATFRRSDGGSSPYGSLLKERTSKIRPRLNIDFSNPDPSCDQTLNRYNESSCSTLSLPSDTLTPDSLASLYEKTNPSTSNLRADRVSKDCEGIYQERRKSLSALRTVSSINVFQEPKTRQNASSSKIAATYSHCVEEIRNPLICDEKETRCSNSHEECKVPSAFHQELIKKCSNLKSHLKSSLSKDSVSSSISFHDKKHNTRNVLPGLKIEVSSAVPNQHICHTAQNRQNDSNISWPKVPSQPEASIKPQLLPKPFIPPKPDILGERSLNKSHIPVKLERLRNDKIVPSYAVEINNNCISIKELSTTPNSRLLSDVKELSENTSSFSNNENKLTEHGTLRSENKSRLWTNKTLQKNLRSKKCSECLQGSKVKNLVASFNNAFNSSETELTSGSLPFKLLIT